MRVKRIRKRRLVAIGGIKAWTEWTNCVDNAGGCRRYSRVAERTAEVLTPGAGDPSTASRE
jgi:hypothetical protein